MLARLRCPPLSDPTGTAARMSPGSESSADLLRRAMGKRHPVIGDGERAEEMLVMIGARRLGLCEHNAARREHESDSNKTAHRNGCYHGLPGLSLGLG